MPWLFAGRLVNLVTTLKQFYPVSVMVTFCNGTFCPHAGSLRSADTKVVYKFCVKTKTKSALECKGCPQIKHNLLSERSR